MSKPQADAISGSARDAAVQQKLETLKKEYDGLHRQKITTEADIKNLEKSLEKLKATAQENYGTSDIAKLREILENRRSENEDRVAQYEEHINEIKGNLADIEKTQAEET
jgi:bacterioferritin (cytochrome b1)